MFSAQLPLITRQKDAKVRARVRLAAADTLRPSSIRPDLMPLCMRRVDGLDHSHTPCQIPTRKRSNMYLLTLCYGS